MNTTNKSCCCGSSFKNILITGASSGIGEALAIELAQPGVNIALISRRVDKLEEVAKHLQAKGAKVIISACDVTNKQNVEESFKHIIQEFGEIDIAFLNAGIGSSAIAQNFDSQEAEKVMKTNYFGALYWVDCLLPAMQKNNKGTICFTSSMMAYRALPGCATYCASKAALTAFVESSQIDLLATNIKFVLVSPMFVETEMSGFDPNRNKLVWSSAEKAAQKIIKGIRRGKRQIVFPWNIFCIILCLRLLPLSLYRLFWKIVRRVG